LLIHFLEHFLCNPWFPCFLSTFPTKPHTECNKHFLMTCNKYVVQLVLILISWCLPGAESSLRLFKPCVGYDGSVSFKKSMSIWPLWFLLPSPCHPTMFWSDLSPTTSS
jgi:hypothetical protein